MFPKVNLQVVKMLSVRLLLTCASFSHFRHVENIGTSGTAGRQYEQKLPAQPVETGVCSYTK